MPETTRAELEQIGREAARDVAGADAVQEVEAVPGETADRSVYYFTFLIDQTRARQRPGLIMAGLIQRLSDELHARHDERFPFVRLLDRTDWDQRASARPY